MEVNIKPVVYQKGAQKCYFSTLYYLHRKTSKLRELRFEKQTTRHVRNHKAHNDSACVSQKIAFLYHPFLIGVGRPFTCYDSDTYLSLHRHVSKTFNGQATLDFAFLYGVLNLVEGLVLKTFSAWFLIRTVQSTYAIDT